MSQNWALGEIVPGSTSPATDITKLTDALAALKSNFSGASLPATNLVGGQVALDDTNKVYWRRDQANTKWMLDRSADGALVVTKSGAYTSVLADFQKTLICTGTWSLGFSAAATLTDGWYQRVVNSGSGTITLDPNGAETINGAATLTLDPGEDMLVVCDGAGLKAFRRAFGGGRGFKNRLINPRGQIYQRPVAATADDTYFADRWYALTQTGTVLPSVLYDPEDGFPVGIRLTQSQASAQRFGFAQIIEGKNCKDMRGGSGVLVPRIRVSNSQAIRYAILGWTSTEDGVTSDVVNDWTSAIYTAGNFFLAANLSVIAVGAQTPSANTWTSLDAITAALGSTFNNIICMVWIEGTAAQNFTLDFDYLQFESGSTATTFETLDFEVVLAQCQRYYERSYDVGVATGAINAGGNVVCRVIGSGDTANVFPGATFKVTKRVTPTITIYGGSTGTPGKISVNGGVDVGGTAAAAYIGTNGFPYVGANSGLGDTSAYLFGWTAASEL